MPAMAFSSDPSFTLQLCRMIYYLLSTIFFFTRSPIGFFQWAGLDYIYTVADYMICTENYKEFWVEAASFFFLILG